MTNIEKLKAWVEEEKKHGLVDVKLFPSENVIRNFMGLPLDPHQPKPDLEAAAGELLTILQEIDKGEDITNLVL